MRGRVNAPAPDTVAAQISEDMIFSIPAVYPRFRPPGAVFGPRDHEKRIRDEKLPPGKGSGPLGPRIEKITSADVWVFRVGGTGRALSLGRRGAQLAQNAACTWHPRAPQWIRPFAKPKLTRRSWALGGTGWGRGGSTPCCAVLRRGD